VVVAMDDLDFVLPKELEAREPPEARGLARDQVRLLVSYRTDDRMIHTRFDELPAVLSANDLVVVNVSATLPAALPATRADGSEIALHLSTRLGEESWVVEARKTAMTAGERLALPAGGTCTFLEPYRGSWRLWRARVDLPEPVFAYLQRWGKPIAYPYVRQQWPLEMYQTVYAGRLGSAEMPSAGRAFSADVIRALSRKGVAMTPIEPRERRATIRRVVRGLTRHGGRNKGCTGKRRQGDRDRYDGRAGARELSECERRAYRIEWVDGPCNHGRSQASIRRRSPYRLSRAEGQPSSDAGSSRGESARAEDLRSGA